MDTPRNLKTIIAGTLLSGGVAVAGFALIPGTAQAQPAPAPLARWCPGQALPSSNSPITWDMNVCHEWHYAWHESPAAGNQVLEGPMPCNYGPGFLPPCKG